ncbi:TonB-dependent receptor [Brevundimonas sp. LM2]|uniref:TonB-dependent receptor n=1 Tax=Brevundimonas sp. LM2 TaxID=1938605 RepID=UPI000983EEF6|nr:TonB-dependent receptor [Brevundimonas sp. LM2]AQR61485.1 TonB-dependent receptor [Brevundimonas sp. LM2]
MSLHPAFAVSVAAILAVATPGTAGAQTRTSYDMPSREVGTALVELCVRAGCAVGFATPPDRTYRSRAVRGARSWQAAVRTMLEGTGLRYRIEGRFVRVWAEPERPEPPPSPRDEPTTLEPVIVTGRFALGIDTALDEKREADVIQDSVSAARIGELPAANLAEALQRVPGVAIEREVGEGQFVSVRGLGPLFQSVTLNGAPVAFNENIRNSTQSGRQFRFRALSADLLGGATLTKTATADLVDGGIGSNIDIRTIRGLGGPDFVSGQLAGHYEARSGALSPDATLSGRWRNGARDLGLVAGLAGQQRQVQFDRFQTQRYRDMEIGGVTVAVPNDLRTTLEREDRDRISGFVGAQWRPNDAVTVDFDALVSRFTNAIREDRIVYDFGERLRNGSLVPDSVRVSDGVLTAATLNNGRISNNLEMSSQTHDNVAASLSLEARAGAWRLRPRLSYSRALSRLDVPLQRIAAVTAEGQAYGFDFGDDPLETRRVARLETDFDLTDASALTWARYGVRATDVLDDDVTGLFAADRDVAIALGPLRVERLELGGQFSDRDRDYQRRDRDAALRPGANLDAGFFGVRVPANAFSGVIRDGDGPWTAADFDRFRAAFVIPGERDGVIFYADDLQPTGTDLQSSYQVMESIAALYARLDVSTDVLGRSASGNLGLRIVGARTGVIGSILGVDANGALEVRPLSSQDESQAWLPSANLAIQITPRTLLRLAAARSLTRPSLADLGAATIPASTLVSAIYRRGQAEIDAPDPATIFTGVGGNPDLKPYQATSFDVSLERYFDGFGAFSAAVFHKTIDDYVLVVDQVERLTFATRLGAPVVAEVMMSRPRNVGRATVSGLELGFSRRLSSGLGVWSSATVTEARSRNQTTGVTTDLQGVSRYAWSVSPFIERGPFEGHVSWTWRSRFRSVADLQGGGVTAFVVGDAGVLDLSASWRLRPDLTAFVEGGNLTDAVDVAYDGDPSRLLQVTRAGRSFSLGLKFAL